MSTTTEPIITIAGATATGKSDLALNLAEHLGGEIINTDSMQFYRGMDIGTAKLPVDERRGITHHLIDILDVREEANVQTFQRQAREAIADIRTRGKRPISSAARDCTRGPPLTGWNPRHRSTWGTHQSEVEADRWGRHRHLQEIDPAAAAKITPNDSRRIVRALEVIELTGRPFSAQLPDYQAIEPTIHLGLSVEREDPARADRVRVEAMWEHGWVDEVRSLLQRGLAEGRTASRAIGYTQIQQYLAGELDRRRPGTDDHQNPTVRTQAGHLVPQRPAHRLDRRHSRRP